MGVLLCAKNGYHCRFHGRYYSMEFQVCSIKKYATYKKR
jgi:hypothetical protein